jgi:hypothetical protein
MKSRIRWAGHLTRMGATRNGKFVGKPDEKGPLRRYRLRREKLKWLLKE